MSKIDEDMGFPTTHNMNCKTLIFSIKILFCNLFPWTTMMVWLGFLEPCKVSKFYCFQRNKDYYYNRLEKTFELIEINILIHKYERALFC